MGQITHLSSLSASGKLKANQVLLLLRLIKNIIAGDPADRAMGNNGNNANYLLELLDRSAEEVIPLGHGHKAYLNRAALSFAGQTLD